MFARRIAPAIDRLAIAVHRHARPLAPAILRAFGLSGAGVFVDARPLLLRGPITAGDLAVVERYAPAAAIEDTLDRHAREGLLRREMWSGTTRYAPSDRGEDLLRQLTALQGRVITELWAGQESGLAWLVAALTRVTERAAAPPPDQYPAFHLHHATPDPPSATPAHLLLTRVTTLRYLRADAHARAWAARDLDSAQAGVMTALWQAGEPSPAGPAFPEPVMERLERRGLVAGNGATWRLTEAGKMMREAIEFDTDSGSAPPWAVLTPDEREAVRTGLESLPS